MNIRILVADDFAPWRRFVSSIILLKDPGWQVVCEVSDGVEAVKKAEELTPELMDLNLPGLRENSLPFESHEPYKITVGRWPQGSL